MAGGLGKTPLRAARSCIPAAGRRGSEQEVGQCVSAGVGPGAKSSLRQRGNGNSSKSREWGAASGRLFPVMLCVCPPCTLPSPPNSQRWDCHGGEHGQGGLGKPHPWVSSAWRWHQPLVAFWDKGPCAGVCQPHLVTLRSPAVALPLGVRDCHLLVPASIDARWDQGCGRVPADTENCCRAES